MVRRYYDLPSLTALAVFEASARHLSFKLAATELNVTPGAVSRQIKAVEEEIGVPLFVRLRTGVMLTNAGEDLYAVLASGFSRASEVFKSVKRGDCSKNVTLACSDSIASMWLMPRMPGFWNRHPEIAVDHLISDNAKDYRRAEVELRIRYGSGSWPDERAEPLFDDTIYPVCGPGFAQEHMDATAESLPELRLLHFNWVDPDWIGWDEVFRRAAIPHSTPRGCRFGKLSVTMQAAQADQGVAVGWHRLVHPLIKEGKLVRITDLELPSPGGYYVTWNDNRTLSPAAELFRKWLREMAAQEQEC
ncbi:LysR substrate-binding domain-containing protein [Allomesorhizobium camelthorni]|uniref:LysR family transcriptional regulator n=1 Tax=Allomesorhizobium camelthorni TaxID=475069 RepID=A0A6G4WN75_9HYPH|nr:LysR substrate-binding domain-containing protein [Mesorhizobium camelthorni]NGO55517.1 LysR family transcriptional regulator [Mesorhizobium camelthorni]